MQNQDSKNKTLKRGPFWKTERQWETGWKTGELSVIEGCCVQSWRHHGKTHYLVQLAYGKIIWKRADCAQSLWQGAEYSPEPGHHGLDTLQSQGSTGYFSQFLDHQASASLRPIVSPLVSIWMDLHSWWLQALRTASPHIAGHHWWPRLQSPVCSLTYVYAVSLETMQELSSFLSGNWPHQLS